MMKHQLRRGALAALLTAACAVATAAPGAHGPDGQHLDQPPSAGSTAGAPRIEAQSEAFELVATFKPGELAILIDRYATNEPVLGATLDVESGSHKAKAAFRAEQGDYVVSDAALLAALARPGEHPLVFTLVAGPEADLLDATLVTRSADAAHADDYDHPHGLARAAWVGAGLAALGLLGAVLWRRGQRKSSGVQA